MSFALCYHAVSERWPAPLSVAPAQLADHLALLTSRGYRAVTLTEAASGSAPARTVAITFDDACRSVFELALPLLSDAGMIASVFAPTAFVGTEQPMSWPGVDHWLETEHQDELMPMSWPELQSLVDAGWEVGSHTRSHPRLTELDGPALDAELRDSRAEIESRLGRPCQSLAYPYGARDERVIAAARHAGYTVAVSLGHGRLPPPTRPLDWPRIFVAHADTGRRFRVKTSVLARRLMSSRIWDVVAAARRRLGNAQAP